MVRQRSRCASPPNRSSRRTFRWSAIGGVAAALALATPLVASPGPSAPAPAPDPSTGTIVVTGHGRTEAARVRALTRAITPVPGFDDPVARFSDPICVAAIGLSRPVLELVADRLVEDAQRAGLTLAGRDCAPNLLVMFVGDGHAELDRLLRTRPALFGSMSPHEALRVIDEPGPVHVLATDEVRSRDGDRIHLHDTLPMLNVSSASRLVLSIRRDTIAAIVVVDRAAAVGRSPLQLADYAAMRGLATTRPKGAHGGNTILTLFDADASPPEEMTGFDRGYLKALYAAAPNLRSIDMPSRIADGINRDGATATPAAPARTPPDPASPHP